MIFTKKWVFLEIKELVLLNFVAVFIKIDIVWVYAQNNEHYEKKKGLKCWKECIENVF